MSTLNELYITLENLRKLNFPIDEVFIVNPATPITLDKYKSFRIGILNPATNMNQN